MRPEQAFAGKTRIIKKKGHGAGRTGLVKEIDLMSGKCIILWDDTLLAEKANIYELESSKNGSSGRQ